MATTRGTREKEDGAGELPDSVPSSADLVFDPEPLVPFPNLPVGDQEEREPATILIVDDLEVNRRVLKGWLKGAHYRILEVRRASGALEVLDREKIDLIIVDLMLPELGGLEFCRLVKSRRSTQLIPILIITSVQGSDNEIAGMESGADEFLTRPLYPTVVRARVRAMLRNKAATDSLDEAETILFTLAQAVEHRDSYTGGHCDRLARYSMAIGMRLGLGRKELLALHRGGYLHDIGKICVPDGILFKRGPLAPEEWQVMRLHPVSGERICMPLRTLRPVLPIIRYHHEKWDGSGYPDGLRGEDIPLLARILQTADIYDALTTERPYKPAHSHEASLQTMREEVGFGWREPRMVELLESLDLKSSEPEFSDQLTALKDQLG